MTASSLAISYFVPAQQRLEVLPEYLKREAWPVAVRESEEIVELATKAMLRFVGVEPPKWHDVGSLLREYQQRFAGEVQNRIEELAAQSMLLRKDRENAFYGDIDLLPENVYGRDQALAAFASAELAVQMARLVIHGR